jgi:hypothetical protein
MDINDHHTKEELEKVLIKAQIVELEKLNRYGFLREMAPAFSAIIYSIAASVVVILLMDNVVKDSLVKLSGIEEKISLKENELSSLNEELDKRAKENQKLVGKASNFDQGVDLSITLQNHGNLGSMILAVSKTENVKLEAFDRCAGKFSFPGSVPAFNTASCPPLREDNKECRVEGIVTKCWFGPISVMSANDVGSWITATQGLKKAVRYVNLSSVK